MKERITARVLLLDPADRLLLLSAVDEKVRDANGKRPADSLFWFTPGGEIERGESVTDAARRELAEETGIVDVEMGSVVWYGEHTLLFSDEPVRLRESFVLARTGTVALTSAGWQEAERAVLKAMRWWTPDELRTSRELVLPALIMERASGLRDLFDAAQSPEGVAVEQIDMD